MTKERVVTICILIAFTAVGCVADSHCTKSAAQPIPVITCSDFTKPFDPAYLTNGMVGIRPGMNPLEGGKWTIVSGFVRDCSWEPFEEQAVAPYPLRVDIVAGDHSILNNPEKVKIISQTLDMNNGELLTKMRFELSSDAYYDIEVLNFVPKTISSVVCQQIKVTCNRETGFDVRALLKQGIIQERNKLGVHLWGDAANRGYGLKAGETATIDMMIGMVSEFYSPDPQLQARRVAGFASMKGMDRLREENRRAWKELWKGRIVVHGASDILQAGIDASYFYVMASASPYCLTGMGPYAFSNNAYFGHVFWDMDSWVYPPVLALQPDAARSMMDYRYRSLDASIKKAATFGFDGAMYAWEGSVIDGHETCPSTASTGWAEQHIIPDVAIAMWQYCQASGDARYLDKKGWPVIENCAKWIASRVIRTDRGYEILNVQGVDEHHANVDNSTHMNLACMAAMEDAIEAAEKVGEKVPAKWRDIVKNMWLPKNDDGAIIPYDGVEVHEKAKGYSVGSSSFLIFVDPPIALELLKKTFEYEETLRAIMDPAPNCPCSDGANAFPCPAMATCAVMFGHRELAAEMFAHSVNDYTLEPYLTHGEYMSHTDGSFITSQGSQLQGLIFGFTGLRIGDGKWTKYDATLPAGWEKIEIGRIYIEDKPYKVIAEDGKKAKLIELE